MAYCTEKTCLVVLDGSQVVSRMVVATVDLHGMVKMPSNADVGLPLTGLAVGVHIEAVCTVYTSGTGPQ